MHSQDRSRSRIDCDAPVQHKINPCRPGKSGEIDYTIIKRMFAGYPARHHTGISQGGLRRKQRSARRRASAARPVGQHGNMGMTAANKQDITHRALRPRRSTKQQKQSGQPTVRRADARHVQVLARSYPLTRASCALSRKRTPGPARLSILAQFACNAGTLHSLWTSI